MKHINFNTDNQLSREIGLPTVRLFGLHGNAKDIYIALTAYKLIIF